MGYIIASRSLCGVFDLDLKYLPKMCGFRHELQLFLLIDQVSLKLLKLSKSKPLINHQFPKYNYESLNSDGQQFHQYQQNKFFSPLLTEHNIWHWKSMSWVWNRHKNVVGSQSRSPMATHMQKNV